MSLIPFKVHGQTGRPLWQSLVKRSRGCAQIDCMHNRPSLRSTAMDHSDILPVDQAHVCLTPCLILTASLPFLYEL